MSVTTVVEDSMFSCCLSIHLILLNMIIQERLEGISSNVYLDSKMNGLDFGGQMSNIKVTVMHKTCFWF